MPLLEERGPENKENRQVFPYNAENKDLTLFSLSKLKNEHLADRDVNFSKSVRKIRKPLLIPELFLQSKNKHETIFFTNDRKTIDVSNSHPYVVCSDRKGSHKAACPLCRQLFNNNLGNLRNG